jgi:hypothetical protein
MFFLYRDFLSQNLTKKGLKGDIRDQLDELYPTMSKKGG